jgi:RNA polymerase sigma-70 factor (ECF subfamily)
MEKMATIFARSSVKSRDSDMDSQYTDDAFEQAFNLHWISVCHTLYRLVGDWDEAEDLALQVFSRLQNNPPKDEEKTAGWLRRVATNAGLNALRSRQRRQRYEKVAGMLKLQQAASRDPEQEVVQRETCRQVRQVIAKMKPRAARLLVYRMMGLSYAQIAAALNVTPGSVGTLLTRAEKDFARRYRALEGSDESH